VLVQELVDVDVSGVLFTVNPANGSWREMVVEAVFGLGEGLVSGMIAPHTFVVRRPRDGLPRGLRRLAERVRLQVVQEELPELPEMLVAGPSGPVRRPVPAERRGARTLTASEVRRLCRLGLAAERAIGGPCDVEWVRDVRGDFVLVQARPITATAVPRDRAVLFTRRFVGERWSEPATPLGWSMVAPILTSFVSYPDTERELLGGGAPFRLYDGWPYVNTTIFRHLAFKLPGSPPPSFMTELLPPEEEAAFRRAFAVAPDLAVYASILRTTFAERRWRRFRWNPFTNPEHWDAYVTGLQEFLAQPPPEPTPAARVARVEAHLEQIREYVGIHLCSLLFANLSWQLLDGQLAHHLPGGHAALRDALAVSPPGNLTVATNRALRALSKAATPAELDALAAGARPGPGPFADALAAFLAEYGHRSDGSWELMAPRWRDHPEALAPLLLAQRGAALDPDEQEARSERRHREALATVRRELGGTPALGLVELLLRYTRRYLLLRENQRFWFDRLLLSAQDELRALGAPVAGEDTAFLTWPELRAAALGEAPAPLDAAARRQAAWERQRTHSPPVFLRGDDPVVGAEPGPRMTGLGISPGRRRGPVRVLRSLQDGGALQPGEVLVARSVDPAWTPLFLSAGAVVLELGSMLSHGAVVAREYGVPAVVNVEAATSRLVDGQDVTVDGTRGVVFVHDGVRAPRP
jgi:phosphohistidine swiveling domain-containing protein